MILSVRQRDCLEKMGISLYERKKTIDVQSVYWICVDEALTESKQQLLSRMLTALRWPQAQCITFQNFTEIKQNDEPIAGILFNDKSCSLFDDLLKRYQQIIQLPSLETLLVDIEAKKKAWQKMQGIRNLQI